MHVFQYTIYSDGERIIELQDNSVDTESSRKLLQFRFIIIGDTTD